MTNCDFCKKQAVYDGKSVLGPWAYACEDHKWKLSDKKGLRNKLKLDEQGNVLGYIKGGTK